MPDGAPAGPPGVRKRRHQVTTSVQRALGLRHRSTEARPGCAAITSPVSPRAVRPEPDDPVQVLAFRDALGPGGNLGREDCQAGQAGHELAAGLREAIRQQDGQALGVLVEQGPDDGHGGQAGFSGH